MYCYAECHYAECRYAECRYAECRYAECRYAECRCDMLVRVETPSLLCRTVIYNSKKFYDIGLDPEAG
jgi:hypothetical protein